jgi:hypothetical protein
VETVDFAQVLACFESNGWQLKKTWGNYRVFINPDDQEQLPWLIPVDDRKVSVEYYERIQRFFEDVSQDP